MVTSREVTDNDSKPDAPDVVTQGEGDTGLTSSRVVCRNTGCPVPLGVSLLVFVLSPVLVLDSQLPIP